MTLVDAMGNASLAVRGLDSARALQHGTLVQSTQGGSAFGGNLSRNNPGGNDESQPEGPQGNGPYSISGAALRTTPEMWNPLSPGSAWTLWKQPEEQIGRPYHSTAILLPSGKIIVGGGEKEATLDGSAGDLKRKFQIFSPPYGGSDTWEGARPTWLANPPSEYWYGQTGTLSIEVASGRQVSKIALVSLGSTTHAFTANQRVVFLAKGNLPTTGSGTTKSVSVTMPASAKLAPPGYYMLFAVDNEGSGVPSEAKIVRLRDNEPLGLKDGSVIVGRLGTMEGGLSGLRVACNDYYQGGLLSVNQSGTHTVEVELESTVNVWTSVTEIRAHVESKTSVPTTVEVFIKNTTSGVWESSGTSTNGTTETLTSYTRTFSSPNGNYFDFNTDPELMRARVKWTASSSFEVSFDAFELAVKP